MHFVDRMAVPTPPQIHRGVKHFDFPNLQVCRAMMEGNFPLKGSLFLVGFMLAEGRGGEHCKGAPMCQTLCSVLAIGCHRCFKVFDEDSSKTLSFKEFKRACRIYGFRANLSLGIRPGAR